MKTRYPWDMDRVRDCMNEFNKWLIKTEHSLYHLAMTFIEQTGIKYEHFYIQNKRV